MDPNNTTENLRATAEAAKNKVSAKMDDMGINTEAAKDKMKAMGSTAEAAKDKVNAKMRDITTTTRSPAAALNDKLGTTLGSKGFFSSALQFAKLNSWVWGSAAAVGLVAYYFSNSLRKDKPKDVVVVVDAPRKS